MQYPATGNVPLTPVMEPEAHDSKPGWQTLLLRLLQGQRDIVDPGEMMRAASEAVGTYLNIDRAGFFEIREDDWLDFQEGWTAGRLPLLQTSFPAAWIGTGYLAEVRAGKTLGISDTRLDPLTSDSSFSRIRTVSLIGAPIIRNGRWHAGLYVNHAEARLWTAEEIGFVREVADQTWDFVERAKAVTALRESEARFRFLSQLDDATRPLTAAYDITQAAARLLGEHLAVNRCAYADVEADEDTFNLTGDYNRGVESIVGRYTFRQFGDECLRLMREGKAYAVVDTESDSRTAEVRESYRLTRIRSVVCVPLRKAGRFVAAMAVHQITPREWRIDEIELLYLVANRCWESIERAHVTRELQISERRLRLSQKAGRIGSFEWFLQEKRIIWSPEHEALYGLSEGQFEGALQDWKRRVIEEDAERVIALVEQCVLQREEECSFEFRAVLPDGELRWLRGQGQLFYGDEVAAHRMVGVSIDIDAPKQAEAHLYQQWRTFDTVLSHTPDHVYTLDLQGCYTYANLALLTFLGRPLEEVLGRDFGQFDYPSELVSAFGRQLQHVVEKKESLRGYAPFMTAGGETRHYEYILVPVLSAAGIVESVAGTTRDITERREAEEQERKRQEQLRESARLESLGVMAGGIAHDFNNLLTGILGNASLLVDNEGATEEDRAIADQIRLGAERAADLTKQMLAFSGKGRFVVEVLDLNGLVQENLTLLRASLSRSVTAVVELSLEPCWIEADRGQMQQVIMNLLINASEAVGDRPGHVVIRTGQTTRAVSEVSKSLQSMLPAGDYVVFEVQDDGCGMSVDTLKKIFDPFFTTKFTGRGLGLAAVLGIVKGHQGDIDVISKPGSGTTFRVVLPLASNVYASDEPPLAPQTAAGCSAQTVLVVDDEEIVRSIATAALERRGYDVLTANDGSEALEALAAHPAISVIILDLTMPVMTGEQALPLIKAAYPHIPVILSSGYSEAEISRRFASSGIIAVLQKPYTSAAIFAKVSQALQPV